MKKIFLFAMLLLLVTGCAGPTQTALPTETLQATVTPTEIAQIATPGKLPDRAGCKLSPVTAPTLPAVIPGYTELDPTTGLHITGKYQEIDLASYRLKISGKVDFPQELSFDDLRCMPEITLEPVLICPGYFEDVTTWTGVRLQYLLELAGVQSGAENVALVSADGYEADLSMKGAMLLDNFIAYQWKDEPLPILHGFPVRAVIPSMQGSKWVKWLVEIRVD